MSNWPSQGGSAAIALLEQSSLRMRCGSGNEASSEGSSCGSVRQDWGPQQRAERADRRRCQQAPVLAAYQQARSTRCRAVVRSDLQLRIPEGYCARALPRLLALSQVARNVIVLLGWSAWLAAALPHAAAALQVGSSHTGPSRGGCQRGPPRAVEACACLISLQQSNNAQRATQPEIPSTRLLGLRSAAQTESFSRTASGAAMALKRCDFLLNC